MTDLNRAEPTCYRTKFSIRQFRLTKWSVLVRSTTHNVSYIHPSHDYDYKIVVDFLECRIRCYSR